MITKKYSKKGIQLVKGGVALGYAGSLPGGEAGLKMASAYGKVGGVLGSSMVLNSIDELAGRVRRKK